MKIWIQTLALNRNDVVSSMSFEEIQDLRNCRFGNARIEANDNSVILVVEKPEKCEIFIDESTRIPRTVFNGKNVNEPLETEVKPGDVLVVYTESNIAYLVFKETIMVIDNPV